MKQGDYLFGAGFTGIKERIMKMKVKDLIKKLKTFNPNKNVCIYHQKLDDNYWDMDIQDDECNNTDVRITPFIKGE